MKITHVTEWGLADCAGILFQPGRSRSRQAVIARLKRRGLHRDTVACDGSAVNGRCLGENPPPAGWSSGDVIFTTRTTKVVPTCERCSVLRDAALEGRLPEVKR